MSLANRCNLNRRQQDAQQCKLVMAEPAPVRKSSLSIHDARIAGLYDLEETIGKGHFAVVKLASHVFTGEKVAVKVIDKTKFDSTMATHFMQEVRCMKLVQHPNIVRLYEVIDTHTKLFLILELGDYDMYDFIMKNADKGCPELDAQQYFCQIIKAIDYCHKLHVVHRDLKPENVVFFEKLGMVKLTDFGFSNKFTPGEQLATSCGSLAYSAPEILLGDAYDAPAVDVWSLGVILYMLLCGRLPFQEANDSETLTKILDCKYCLPDSLSGGARNLISRMLVKEASKRATLKEIVDNDWVSSGERGLDQVLPLVGRDVLPESAHATIIEQMVAGGVDSEDKIMRSLEDDDYSYTTATYYLLAERVLSSYREEQARELLAFKPSPPLSPTTNASDTGLETGEPSTSSTPSGPQPPQATVRCRSRSNSWRGGVPAARRACTILKEESEEELSTYLRTSSRQSSRYTTTATGQRRSTAGGGSSDTSSSSNALSADLDESQQQQLKEREMGKNRVETQMMQPTVAAIEIAMNGGAAAAAVVSNGSGFDELSPIRELETASVPYYGGGFADSAATGSGRYPDISEAMAIMLSQAEARDQQGRMREFKDQESKIEDQQETREPSMGVIVEGEENRETVRLRAKSDGWTLGRKMTSPMTSPPQAQFRHSTPPAPEMLWRINRPTRMLGRRNSSPSVSMFGTLSGGAMSGSREHISPQAIQELLELSRLSVVDGRRRAASPDSRRSSRSPSPPSSSGRSSPAISVGRIKTVLTSSVGMRKLSSSPHLLGICEESEESEQASSIDSRHIVTRRSVSSASGSHVSPAAVPPPPCTKSKSETQTETLASTMLTYSKVRMIRPRQAVVSPDMARRYEAVTAHRFPTATRTRRSTSCSSSEASDDDSSERRMNLLVSKCCRCTADDPNNDDDPSKGGGGFLTGPGGNSSAALGPHRLSTDDGSTVSKSSNAGGSDGAHKCRRCLSLKDATTTPLHPIMEIPPNLLSPSLFSRSETAKRAVADWARTAPPPPTEVLEKEWIKRCIGTPPRNSAATRDACDLNLNCQECMRALRKSRSLPAAMDGGAHKSDEHSELVAVSPYYDSDGDIFSETEMDSSEGWLSTTDSGCSSDGETEVFSWRFSKKSQILAGNSKASGQLSEPNADGSNGSVVVLPVLLSS